MRKRNGQLQLHAHAARKVAYLRLRRDAELVKQGGERACVPVLKRWRNASNSLLYLELGGEGARVEHHADAPTQTALRFDGRGGAEGLAEQADLACVKVQLA